MKKLSLFISFFITTFTVFAQSPAIIKEYITTYKDIAVQEMIRTGVPASITLAQGIHETGAGTSKLVRTSNNHFGIKCKAEWKGETVSHDDDAKGECFRKYDNSADSYKDHSDFLKTRSHYASLFELDPVDYESWAYGLKKAGYATNPKYPQILIKLIRDYRLDDYTLVALGRKVMVDGDQTVAGTSTISTPANNSGNKYPIGIFKINSTNVIFAVKGISYLAVAEKHRVPLSLLFEFNDMLETEVVETDRLVFLQRKRKEGSTEFHTVQRGETLYDIAQSEGIRLESLISYNYLKEGVEPAPGRSLNLQSGTKNPFEKITSSIQKVVDEIIPKSSTKKGDKDYIIHTVLPKETMFAIAKKYTVAVDEIRDWNDLETDKLKTGQQLRIIKTENVRDQTAR